MNGNRLVILLATKNIKGSVSNTIINHSDRPVVCNQLIIFNNLRKKRDILHAGKA